MGKERLVRALTYVWCVPFTNTAHILWRTIQDGVHSGSAMVVMGAGMPITEAELATTSFLSITYTLLMSGSDSAACFPYLTEAHVFVLPYLLLDRQI